MDEGGRSVGGVTDWFRFSNPNKPRTCTNPSWSPTPGQVADTIERWRREGSFRGDVVWLPLKPTLRRAAWINFDSPGESELDAKGGRPHVTKLVHLMCERVPLPPAVGYYDSSKTLVIHDGNHRVTAAKRLKLPNFPILIYTPAWRT